MGAEILSKIGSILGIPIKTDRYSKEKTTLRYARLLIDISLDSTSLDFIKFFNDNEVLIRQQVVYEWKPLKCAHCHMFGHEKQICKKKGGVRQEWRRVQSANPPPNLNIDPSPNQQRIPGENEGYNPAHKRAIAGQTSQVRQPVQASHRNTLLNSFQASQEDLSGQILAIASIEEFSNG